MPSEPQWAGGVTEGRSEAEEARSALTPPACGGYPGSFNSASVACTCTRYYLLLTTCTYRGRLYGRFGPERGRLYGLEGGCLYGENSQESQAFVESHARGAERPQGARTGGGWPGGVPRPRVRPPGAILELR